MCQREVAESWPWPQGVTPPPSGRGDLPSGEYYYDLLKPICAHVDIWQIVYNHPMAGAQAIVEWFKGSSLQPLLAALDADGQRNFSPPTTKKSRAPTAALRRQGAAAVSAVLSRRGEVALPGPRSSIQ